MKTNAWIVSIVLGVTLAGCVSKQSQLGVRNKWREQPAPVFHKGSTTRSEVLEALGPPSQVIGLHDQTLFYYLREQQKVQAMITVLYNRTRENIIYDRAIFFFDSKGVMTEFALSDETVDPR